MKFEEDIPFKLQQFSALKMVQCSFFTVFTLTPLHKKRLLSYDKNPFFNCFLYGWKTGFEPATLGTTNQCSNQLSYNHHIADANIIHF